MGLIIANQIVRSVRSIETNIALMREGDLTRVFSVATSDEVGTLSNDLNRFLNSLRHSVNNVQQVSHENVQMRTSLLANPYQTDYASAHFSRARRGSWQNLKLW